MARYHYERLSAESSSYLLVESSGRYAHSSTTLIFETGTLAGPQDGKGLDFPTIQGAIRAALEELPRYRQRLKWIPIENHPVWVDDESFSLAYHLRHTCLPWPGSPDELAQTVARIHSQRLDRTRPLWECWVIEGVGDGRFAIVLKSHHCLLDAEHGGDLFATLLSSDPELRPLEREAAPARPRPSTLELGRDELLRRMSLPRRAVDILRRAARDPEKLGRECERRARAVGRLAGLRWSRDDANAPLRGANGPHRRFASVVMPLEQAIDVHRRLDCTVNDVVLATATGALRHFLQERFVNPAMMDMRVAVPMSARAGSPGDSYTRWVVRLPVWQSDPLERIATIREQTAELQRQDPALGAQTLFDMAEWSGSRRLSEGVRTLASHPSADLELTYAPGPEQPLFLCGARMRECYGQAPLRHGGALGISVFSYDGNLYWGLNADFDRLPDLESIEKALPEELARLQRAARAVGGSEAELASAS